MSKRFEIIDTRINGLKVLQRMPIGDSRGYLERLFCKNELTCLLEHRDILQINHTLTEKKGTVRGLHFQYPPHAETKFVTCLRGEVYDVAIDLREDSATFLDWHAEHLTDSNWKTMVIPEGFAHGFQTLTDNCELLYLHTEAYRAESEAGLNSLDTFFAIDWPLPITERSTRDQQHPMIDHLFKGVSL